MSIWKIINENPDAVTTILAAVFGLFGFSRWRQNAKEATLAQVDRWANTVAAGLVLGASHNLISASAEDFMAKALASFRLLARAAGVTLRPEHEARATAMMHAALVAAGESALPAAAARMHAAAQSAVASLAKLPWDKL